MTEFLRDPKTGYVYAYKDGKLVGPMQSMGENAPQQPTEDLWKREHRNGKG